MTGDPQATALIHPLVTGQDLRPWYSDAEGRFLLVIPNGWTKETFGQSLSETEAWGLLAERHPSIARHLARFADRGRARGDKGDYWWELRPCDYYDAFDTPKIVFPDIAKLPRYSLDRSGIYLNNTGYFIPNADDYLLGVLQSRVSWFVTSQISQPLRLGAGLWQYRLFPQFVERLPIPTPSSDKREAVARVAREAAGLAAARYAIDARVRRRIESDLAAVGTRLNTKLTAWWTLDFPTFRAEVKKALKADIPVRERDDWAAWLDEQRAEHDRLTADIVRLETDLNARVYALFDLSPADIAVIEQSTKYPYGEV